MKNNLFSGMLALAILIGAMSFSMACSCIALPETEDRFENAALVFSGNAESILSLESYPVLQKTTFQVDKYWKLGELSGEKSLEIETYENDGANCGFTFEEGENYIVYAYLDSETGKITTNSCMQTMILSEEEVNRLNSLATPLEPLSSGIVEETPRENFFSKFVNWIKNLFS